MLSTKATVLPAAAAIGQLQRRTPCLAPCHAAAAAATGGRPAALSCSPSRAALAGATAPRHRRRSPRVSASAGGGGSDLESEGLEQQSFSHLAKTVANKLAETAGQEGAYNGLKLWCVYSRVCGGVRQPRKLARLPADRACISPHQAGGCWARVRTQAGPDGCPCQASG